MPAGCDPGQKYDRFSEVPGGVQKEGPVGCAEDEQEIFLNVLNVHALHCCLDPGLRKGLSFIRKAGERRLSVLNFLNRCDYFFSFNDWDLISFLFFFVLFSQKILQL